MDKGDGLGADLLTGKFACKPYDAFKPPSDKNIYQFRMSYDFDEEYDINVYLTYKMIRVTFPAISSLYKYLFLSFSLSIKSEPVFCKKQQAQSDLY